MGHVLSRECGSSDEAHGVHTERLHRELSSSFSHIKARQELKTIMRSAKFTLAGLLLLCACGSPAEDRLGLERLFGAAKEADTAAPLVYGQGDSFFPITFDATALSQSAVSLDVGNTFIDTRTVQQVSFAPGTYAISVNYSSNSDVSFTITPDGKVAYDPSLEGVLSGSGGERLTISGRPITVDATALSQGAMEPWVYSADFTTTNIL